MPTPHEVWAKAADARLRAIAPELYRDGRLRPEAWGTITKFPIVSHEVDAGYRSWHEQAITIDQTTLDFLLGCAERLAAMGGNAPALSDG